MNFCTWNVNGLRACMNKGFMEFFKSIDADIFAVQETKLQPGQISLDLDGYEQFSIARRRRDTRVRRFS